MREGVEYAREILFSDLPSEFVIAVAKEVGWIYADLEDGLTNADYLTNDCREEEFNKRRGDAVRDGLANVCRRFGVPFELVRLAVNGQHKIVVSAGRVMIIVEAVDAFNDEPVAADYKIALADTHGHVRQLELDLGDRPVAVRPSSESVLAVLLHGPAGKGWNSKAKQLGTLSLGVPDASYGHWVLRPDLHAIAVYGEEPDPRDSETEVQASPQEDNVVVSRKRKNAAKGTA